MTTVRLVGCACNGKKNDKKIPTFLRLKFGLKTHNHPIDPNDEDDMDRVAMCCRPS